MKRKKNNWICFLLVWSILILIVPNTAHADDWYGDTPGYFTVYDESGKQIFVIGSEVAKGDGYVSENNRKYEIIEVNKGKKTAKAKFLEEIKLPDISEETALAAFTDLQARNNRIGLYNTHSDESYVPSDGASSIRAHGGVFDVSAEFGKELEKRGVNAIVDKTPHDPHDAGAYRRSRKTAVKLLRDDQPVALFDVHRDAVPKEEYIKKVAGEQTSKVRIVIGRRNQNYKVNEALAYRIKAIADKEYPGLIKDIFIGHGNYNQELLPKSLLFEFGTYSHTKERALKSTGLLADVVVKTLFGGKPKAATSPANKVAVKKGTAAPNRTTPGTQTRQQVNVSPANRSSRGSGSGIFWLLAVVVIAGIGFLVLSTGGKEIWSKVSKTRREFTSFFGHKKDKEK